MFAGNRRQKTSATRTTLQVTRFFMPGSRTSDAPDADPFADVVADDSPDAPDDNY